MARQELLLSLLFIFIELLPVLMKVMMNLGSRFTYDDVLEAKETTLRAALNSRNDIELKRVAADADFAVERHKDLIDQERKATGFVNQRVVDVQKSVIEQALDVWQEDALRQSQAALQQHGTPVARVPRTYP